MDSERLRLSEIDAARLPWLREVDAALERDDLPALSRIYHNHAFGHTDRQYCMVRRAEHARVGPGGRGYMTLLLWRLGWDYDGDLAAVRARLGFSEGGDPDEVDRHVRSVCERLARPCQGFAEGVDTEAVARVVRERLERAANRGEAEE